MIIETDSPMPAAIPMTEIRVRSGHDDSAGFGIRINGADRSFLLGIDLGGQILPKPVSPRILDLLERIGHADAVPELLDQAMCSVPPPVRITLSPSLKLL